MLEFLYNGTSLPFPESASVKLKARNPLFFDGGAGSHTYPFELFPDSQIRKQFNFPHRPSNNASLPSGEGLFTWNKKPLLRGTAILKEWSEKRYSGYLQVADGDLFASIKGKMLQDLPLVDLEYTPTEFTDYIAAHFDGCFPNFPWVAFPLYNREFYRPYVDAGIFVESDLDIFNFQNKFGIDDTGSWWLETLYPDPFTPFLYVGYALEAIFESLGWQVTENIFRRNEKLQRMTIYNNHSVSAGFGLRTDREHYWFNPGSQLPEMTVIDFFDSVKKTFGVDFYPDYTFKNIRILPYQTVQAGEHGTIDLSRYLIGNLRFSRVEDSTTNGLKISYSPDDEGFWQDRVKDIYDDHLFIKDAVDEVADLPDPDTNGALRYVRSVDMWFVYKCTDPQVPTYEWNFYSDNYPSLIIGSGESEYELGCGTLSLVLANFYNGMVAYDWAHFARADQPGHDHNLIQSQNKPEIGLKFLYYAGWQESKEGYDYPYGTSDNYAKFSIPPALLDFDVSLRIDGDYGIYNTFIKPYHDWRAANVKIAEGEFLLPYDAIRDFQFQKRVLINGTLYIAESIETTFRKSFLDVSTIVLRPL